MRILLSALVIAAGVVVMCREDAEAMPAGGTAVKEAVTAGSPVELARLASHKAGKAKSNARRARQTGKQ